MQYWMTEINCIKRLGVTPANFNADGFERCEFRTLLQWHSRYWMPEERFGANSFQRIERTRSFVLSSYTTTVPKLLFGTLT